MQARLLSFIGIPGSGKSTQIRMLSQQLGSDLVVLSVPRLLRTRDLWDYLTPEEKRLLEELQPRCDESRLRGHLSPLDVDRILFSLIPRLADKHQYIVLDGAPRGPEQALAYAEIAGSEVITSTQILFLHFPRAALAFSMLRQFVRSYRERGGLKTLSRLGRMWSKSHVYMTRTHRAVGMLEAMGATVHRFSALSPRSEINRHVNEALRKEP